MLSFPALLNLNPRSLFPAVSLQTVLFVKILGIEPIYLNCFHHFFKYFRLKVLIHTENFIIYSQISQKHTCFFVTVSKIKFTPFFSLLIIGGRISKLSAFAISTSFEGARYSCGGNASFCKSVHFTPKTTVLCNMFYI